MCKIENKCRSTWMPLPCLSFASIITVVTLRCPRCVVMNAFHYSTDKREIFEIHPHEFDRRIRQCLKWKQGVFSSLPFAQVMSFPGPSAQASLHVQVEFCSFPVSLQPDTYTLLLGDKVYNQHTQYASIESYLIYNSYELKYSYNLFLFRMISIFL